MQLQLGKAACKAQHSQFNLFQPPSPYLPTYHATQADPSSSWAAYIAGCLLVLARDGPDAPALAARLAGSSVSVLVQSRVPEGKGVSSSAAVEVATMTALAGALGVAAEALPGRQLAILCQRVENLVVGAPCGIMDQVRVTAQYQCPRKFGV